MEFLANLSSAATISILCQGETCLDFLAFPDPVNYGKEWKSSRPTKD
jgi:hypothetical protein